jgi:hypothetical protein
MSTRLHTLHLPPLESHQLVRERTFTGAYDLGNLITLLHSERATGQIIVNMTQGGVGSITFREQHKVFPDK